MVSDGPRVIRVGCLAPVSIQEETLRAFYQLVPPGFKLVHSTLQMDALDDDQLTSAVGRATRQAFDLVAYGVDIVVLNGTPTILTAGEGFADEFRAAIRTRSAVPVGFSHLYQRAALRHLGLAKLVVVTPWGDRVGPKQNERLRQDLRENGFEVAGFFGLDLPLSGRGRLSDRYLDEAVARLLPTVDAKFDGLYIPCANWPVVAAIPRLEARYGVPVVASTPALIWGAARDLGAEVRRPECGRLLG